MAYNGSDSAPPQIHVHPEPQKVILFGNRVFENVISQDELIPD